MNDGATPPWLDTPCPSWCCREHRADDHPEDRRHQGAAQLVTLTIAPAPLLDNSDPVPVNVVVHADRPDGSDHDWLRIESAESPDVRLALTARSTRELIRALRVVLDEISG